MTTKKRTATGQATRREHRTYDLNAPGLEHALERLLTIVTDMAKTDLERHKDPDAQRLEMARIELERDRMKLQWAEHEQRTKEFTAQEEERADRRREQEERREAERQERYDAAALRGDLWDVRLMDKGSSLIYTIKTIRETTGLGLKEAKEMAESAPTFVARRKLLAEAERVVLKLRSVGAKAEWVKSGEMA